MIRPCRSIVRTFDKYVAIFGREGGVTQMWIADAQKGTKGLATWKKASFPEKVFSVYPGQNKIFNSGKIRITYTSLISPSQTIDYDMQNGQMQVLKEKEVPLYNKDEFACMRLEAPSRDGKTKFPYRSFTARTLLWKPMRAREYSSSQNPCRWC